MLKVSCRRIASLAPAMFLLAAVSGRAAPPPVPPPVLQTRTDCARPQYASDTLVCDDAELRGLDTWLATAPPPPPRAVGAIWEEDDAWFRRSRMCAFEADHRGCLKAAYLDRQAAVKAAAKGPSVPLRCEGIWGGKAIMASALDGSYAALRDADGFLGAASPVRAVSAWKPALRYRLRGRRVELVTGNGQAIRCSIEAKPVRRHQQYRAA